GAEIVEAVAKAHHDDGIEPLDLRRHAQERVARVVRGQQLAMPGVACSLLEMEIGEGEEPLARPPQGAARAYREALATKGNVLVRARHPAIRCRAPSYRAAFARTVLVTEGAPSPPRRRAPLRAGESPPSPRRARPRGRSRAARGGRAA